MKRVVALTVASHGVARIASIAAPIVVTPFALRVLGTREFAAWLLTAAIVGYVSPGFGVPSALVDIAARGTVGPDRTRIVATVRHAMLLLALLGCATAALAPFVARPLDVPTAAGHGFVTWAIVLAGLSLPFSAVRGICEGLLSASSLNLATAMAAFLGSVSVIAGLAIVPSVYWLLLPSFMTLVVAPGIIAVRLWAREPWLRAKTDWTLTGLIDVGRASAWHFTIAAAWAVIYGTDVWVIRETLGVSPVAAYGLLFTFFSLIAEPTAALVMAIRPIAARMGAEGPEGVREVFQKTARISTTSALVLNGLGLLWSGVALDVWVGTGLYPGFEVTFFLAGFQVLRAVLNASAWTTVPLVGPRPLAIALAGDAALNLALSIALAKAFGLWGVAAGSFAGTALCSAWYMPRKAGALFKTRATGRWTLQAMAGVLPLWGAAFWFQPTLRDVQSAPLVSGLAIAGSLLFSAWLVVRIGFEPQDRRTVLEMVRLGRA